MADSYHHLLHPVHETCPGGTVHTRSSTHGSGREGTRVVAQQGGNPEAAASLAVAAKAMVAETATVVGATVVMAGEATVVMAGEATVVVVVVVVVSAVVVKVMVGSQKGGNPEAAASLAVAVAALDIHCTHLPIQVRRAAAAAHDRSTARWKLPPRSCP
jgi:hypothetical protein